jgi:hypothetical protein
MDTSVSVAKHQAFLVMVGTKLRDLHPYSNGRDEGHDPTLRATLEGSHLVLTCQDTFKLKPNLQRNPKTRADIYLPQGSAIQLADDIRRLVGEGEIGQLVPTDPGAARRGSRALPQMSETRMVRHLRFSMVIAGYTIPAGPGRTYCNLQWPDISHTMMSQPSVHLGVKFDVMDDTVNGKRDSALIRYIDGENKAKGTMRLSLSLEHAPSLAATLRHFGSQQPGT